MLCKEEKGKSQKCDNRFIGTVDYLSNISSILISTKQKTNNNNNTNNILTIKRQFLVSKVIIAMGCYSEYASPLQEILRRCKQ